MNLDENNMNKYLCSTCHFKSSKESNFLQHLSTNKHKKLSSPNLIDNGDNKKTFECKCGKKYKHLSTLCAHRKNCSSINNIESPVILSNSSEEIRELKMITLDIMKNIHEMQQNLLTLCNN
jgi:hypothetical protein